MGTPGLAVTTSSPQYAAHVRERQMSQILRIILRVTCDPGTGVHATQAAGTLRRRRSLCDSGPVIRD